MVHRRFSVGKSILFIHACTVIYGVVIVSRNLERANENDRFKMTALECSLICFLPPPNRILGSNLIANANLKQ